MAAVNYEKRRSGCYLGECASLNIVNEEIIVASGAGVLYPGTVLGRLGVGAATAAAKAGGNTGTGVITLDAVAPVGAGAKAGVYTARATVAAVNGGTFEVKDPDGFVLGTVAVGATFDNDVKFTIADGATDFVVGDGFDITVAAGSGKYVAHDPALNNGAKVAAAILFHKVDATAADAKSVATVNGPAVINGNDLTFKAGIIAADKTAALNALRAKGMKVLPQHAA